MAGLHVGGCQQDTAAGCPSLSSESQQGCPGSASWGSVLLGLSNTQSSPAGPGWAAHSVPECLLGAALVAAALSWVLRTPHVSGDPATLCPRRRDTVPLSTIWNPWWPLTTAMSPPSCLAGLRRWQWRGRAVRGLPSQEVQGPLGTSRLQALPVLCPHKPPPEVQLHSDGRRGLWGVPARVSGAGPSRATAATPGGRQGGAGQRGLYLRLPMVPHGT